MRLRKVSCCGLQGRRTTIGTGRLARPLASGFAASLPPDWSEAASVGQVYGILGLQRTLALGHPEQAAAILDVSMFELSRSVGHFSGAGCAC